MPLDNHDGEEDDGDGDGDDGDGDDDGDLDCAEVLSRVVRTT